MVGNLFQHYCVQCLMVLFADKLKLSQPDPKRVSCYLEQPNIFRHPFFKGTSVRVTFLWMCKRNLKNRTLFGDDGCESEICSMLWLECCWLLVGVCWLIPFLWRTPVGCCSLLAGGLQKQSSSDPMSYIASKEDLDWVIQGVMLWCFKKDLVIYF